MKTLKKKEKDYDYCPVKAILVSVINVNPGNFTTPRETTFNDFYSYITTDNLVN